MYGPQSNGLTKHYENPKREGGGEGWGTQSLLEELITENNPISEDLTGHENSRSPKISN